MVKTFLKKLATLVSILLITLILLELILYFFYKNYHISNEIPALKKYIGQISSSKGALIQEDPKCSKYDDSLFYTLRPGQCRYKGMAFDTLYNINSQGLRDNEESLNKPEIIVLGDSYAMGWGVEQDETFADLIEKSTGLKTLNTAISSYGTARQYLILQRQDLSNLKHIVIQYCANDYAENKSFIESGYKLNVSEESVYQNMVNNKQKKIKKSKRPFRASLIFIRELVRDIKFAMGIKGKNSKDKELLNNVNHQKEFYDLSLVINKIRELAGKDVNIILFESHIGYDRVNSELFNYFSKNKMDNLKVFDSNKIIKKEDYLMMDAHYNSSGHKKLANKIVKIIQEKK